MDFQVSRIADRNGSAGAGPSPRSIVIGTTELTLVPDGEMFRPSGVGVFGVPPG